MAEFWNYTFDDAPAFVETFDELPLWSAPFGLLLLQHIDMRENLTVLDLGSGAGFPLFELAERLGPTSKCYGVDPWENASQRARKKIQQYGVSNVELIATPADQLPFESGKIDLIVSNLGINNFDQPGAVFQECFRVLKPLGKLALTTNLNGHWKEFYAVFEALLRELNELDILSQLQEQQVHRGSVSSVSTLFTQNGFGISRVVEDTFEMRFLNGTAFMNHHFVKLGWLSSWKGIIPDEKWPVIFPKLESAINQYAQLNNGLTLTIPMAFVEGMKA